MTKSPSGALSPYYYKGGYFHGIHYGSYFDDWDLYETNLSDERTEQIAAHIKRLSPRIIKLAIADDKKALRMLSRALKKAKPLGDGQIYFTTDMEEGKTWLVSEC